MPIRFTSIIAVLVTACAQGTAPIPVEPGLVVEPSEGTLEGTFAADGSVMTFRSSAADAQHVALQLRINDKQLDITLDLATNSLVEDGHNNVFQFADRALLLALRDAAIAEHPEWVDTLHGHMLLKVADRYAEVPVGRAMKRHAVDIAPAIQDSSKADQVTSGCGGDSVTCLPGESGTTWAVFSIGNTCEAKETAYGDSVCRGRCGMGCNWFDNDYTWDCLDHDVCLDYSSDCGDEFADAADDWVATVAPLCWGGSLRAKPPTVPVAPPTKPFVNVATGKCLDVSEQNLANGAKVHQWTCLAIQNQQWTVIPYSDGTAKIVVSHSGKCLDLRDGNSANGAEVGQWACVDNDNQKWIVRPVGTSFEVVSKVSGKCLDVDGSQTADGTRIQAWECHHGPNQLWHR
jgi:hypothetical protein